MSWMPLNWQATASVSLSGFALDDPLRGYLVGLTLDLLASALLVWATFGMKTWLWRGGLAAALFAGLHWLGGWQRDPKELAFSLTVILCLLNLGTHARALAAAEDRSRNLQRSASWAQYWFSQVGNLSRQVAFEAVSVLSLVALLILEALMTWTG
jgi:hypothetical protein